MTLFTSAASVKIAFGNASSSSSYSSHSTSSSEDGAENNSGSSSSSNTSIGNHPSSLVSSTSSCYSTSSIPFGGDALSSTTSCSTTTSSSKKFLSSSPSTRKNFDEHHQSLSRESNSSHFDEDTNDGKASSKSAKKFGCQNTMSVQQRPRFPEAKYKIRNLGLLAALLPGLGCYFCLGYTFLFQQDRLTNFTTKSCPQLRRHVQWLPILPAVSYSIGVWQPQKFIWLFVLCFSLPSRLLYGIAYRAQWSLGTSEYRSRSWFPYMINGHFYLLFLEAFGLMAVSIIDIKTTFVTHAFCYAIWVISFNFNMLFTLLLQYHSSIMEVTKRHRKTFYAKCFLFITGYPLSVSTGITYVCYMIWCNSVFYTFFSLAEYTLVGWNSLFYFLMVWELQGSKVEVYIRHKERIARNDLSFS